MRPQARMCRRASATARGKRGARGPHKYDNGLQYNNTNIGSLRTELQSVERKAPAAHTQNSPQEYAMRFKAFAAKP